MEGQQREKTSSLDRVVGNLSEQEKQAVFEKFQKRFETTEIPKLNELEREKTPKEKQIILEANSATNDIRKKFGLEDFIMPEGNIHIIRKEKWASQGEIAVSLPELQRVLIRERERDIHFAESVFHEMIHFKSYNAVQKLTDCDEIVQYRHGLRLFPRSSAKIKSLPDGGSLDYFRDLNEAVTEELTRQYIMNQIDNPLYKNDFDETSELRPEALKRGMYKELLDQNIYSFYKKKDDDTIHTESFSYPAERMSLFMIRNQLWQKNPDIFKSSEEVLDVFARAMFTGYMRELSRLMEKTFKKEEEKSEEDNGAEQEFKIKRSVMRAIGTP